MLYMDYVVSAHGAYTAAAQQLNRALVMKTER